MPGRGCGHVDTVHPADLKAFSIQAREFIAGIAMYSVAKLFAFLNVSLLSLTDSEEPQRPLSYMLLG